MSKKIFMLIAGLALGMSAVAAEKNVQGQVKSRKPASISNRVFEGNPEAVVELANKLASLGGKIGDGSNIVGIIRCSSEKKPDHLTYNVECYVAPAP